ncbi:hypothetical protein GPALN_005571 [Globodera pallida]|nr:hypothetical protein GPALN_005571 [Globodera pallida]
MDECLFVSAFSHPNSAFCAAGNRAEQQSNSNVLSGKAPGEKRRHARAIHPSDENGLWEEPTAAGGNNANFVEIAMATLAGGSRKAVRGERKRQADGREFKQRKS